MVAYIYFCGNIVITDHLIFLFSIALALISILLGYNILRKSSDSLIEIAEKTNNISTENKISLNTRNDKKLVDIIENFNVLLKKLKYSEDINKEQSMEIIKYARDLSLSLEKSRKQEELRK